MTFWQYDEGGAVAGATDEEIGEAIFVGIAMSAGAATAHACIAADAMEKKE